MALNFKLQKMIQKARYPEAMSKKELFTEENIMLNVSFDTKEDAIRTAGEILYHNGYVEKEYIQDMLNRETIVTTYVGNGLAIPHGIANSEKNIKHSGLSFIQVPEGVSFGEEKAYTIIGIAGKDGEHLELLGKIAMIFFDVEKAKQFKTASTKQKILELLVL